MTLHVFLFGSYRRLFTSWPILGALKQEQFRIEHRPPSFGARQLRGTYMSDDLKSDLTRALGP